MIFEDTTADEIAIFSKKQKTKLKKKYFKNDCC
jgi:hypothetical protein